MTARRHYLSCFTAALALALAARPAAAENAPAAQNAKLDPPRLLQFVEARYPADAATTEAVEVELDLVVSADGQVTSVTATAPTGTPFEAAAIEAARQFTFDPARRNGEPISARIRYRYVFASPAPPAPTTGALEGRVLSRADQPLAEAMIVVAPEDGSAVRTLTTAADSSFRCDPGWTCGPRAPGVRYRRHRLHTRSSATPSAAASSRC